MHYVVQFSGGITSWAAARRIADTHGTQSLSLLFADTLIEDEDNYRFLSDAAEDIGAPLIRIADGRNPWQVFRDVSYIGNSRKDPCSKFLKRKLLRRWIKAHTHPSTHTIVFGLDHEEPERLARTAIRQHPWPVLAPLMDRPWLSKADTIRWAKSRGLTPPRLYSMGFSHANCGGFCVKAGQADFQRLLLNLPERYAMHEAEEAATAALIGSNVTILRDRRGGTVRPLSLSEFRERYEATGQYDAFDTASSCACALA